MPFYTDLSDVYDALFPVSKAQRTLLENIRDAGGTRRVVDAGCGSGAQLLPFASAGWSCAGFDPDPAMVAKAREKLSAFPDARVEVGGFEDFSRLAGPAAGLVMCLGNSLVHVPAADAARFLAEAAAALSREGTLLLQILNYERFSSEAVFDLPPMQADGGAVDFRRRYVRKDDHAFFFRTELRIARDGGESVFRNEVVLYPVLPDELEGMLEAAGFPRVRFHGDYALSDFSHDSEALVCLAKRI